MLAGITAPKGKTRFFLVGDVKSSFGINGTIKTTPLPDLWKGAHGVTSDYDIKPTKGTVASSMATVGGAVLKLSIDPTFQPPATVPAGTVQVEAVRIVLDASRSAEDIAVSTLLLHQLLDGVTTSAQLFDGAITLGSSVLVFPQTPKAAFSLDKGLLVVGKGTIKTLSLRCDVAAGAAGSLSFGLTADCGASACGTASYGTALVVVAPSDGQTITVAGGMPGKAHIESVTLGEEAGGQKFVDMAVGQTTPNGSYRVEQSSDLVHWHRVGTLFPGGTGLSVVRIPIDDEDCSFFRVVGEPSGR